MDLPPIRIPDDWSPALDQRRGKRSLPEYVRDLILSDMPKALRAQVSPPKPRGRQAKPRAE